MVNSINQGNSGSRYVGFFVSEGNLGSDTTGDINHGANRRNGLNLGQVPPLQDIQEDGDGDDMNLVGDKEDLDLSGNPDFGSDQDQAFGSDLDLDLDLDLLK